MATVTVHMPDETGNTGHTLFLYLEAGTLLNAGGDALNEVGSSGVFQATVTETLSANYLGQITNSGGDLVFYGTLYDGETTLESIPAVVPGGDATAANQAAILNKLGVAAFVSPSFSRPTTTITVWTNETRTTPISVYDAAGDVVDLTGESLWFGVWDRTRDLQVDVSATGTATGFNVDIPKLPNQSSNLEWVLRKDDATGEGIATGPFVIRAKPEKP